MKRRDFASHIIILELISTYMWLIINYIDGNDLNYPRVIWFQFVAKKKNIKGDMKGPRSIQGMHPGAIKGK